MMIELICLLRSYVLAFFGSFGDVAREVTLLTYTIFAILQASSRFARSFTWRIEEEDNDAERQSRGFNEMTLSSTSQLPFFNSYDSYMVPRASRARS